MNFSTNSAQNSQNSCNKLKPYALCLLATICIHWGIASYQAFIDSALILLCCGGIALIVENKGNIKLAIFKARFLVIATILAAISYKIILDILKKIDYVQDFYNNRLTPLSEMPERIILAFKNGFSFLFVPQMDYIAQSIGIVFGIIFIIAFICLYRARFSLFAKFAIILLFMAMIFSSQTHIILANAKGGGLHLHFYGLMFLYVGIIASAFKLFNAESISLDSNLTRNALIFISCIFIWISALHCLQAQKIHKFTMDRDLAFLNRIVERIENLEGFSYEKQYCGVMFGSPQNAFTKAMNANMLAPWDIGPILGRMMMKDVFRTCDMSADWYMADYMIKENPKDYRIKAYKKRLKRLYDAGILDKLQPFPHKDSIVLFEDIIVFVASSENLIDKIKQDFANGEK